MSLIFLAAAPANVTAAQRGFLTNNCEGGSSMEYAAAFDHRVYLASRYGEDAVEAWGRAVFDLITSWATGSSPTNPANLANVTRHCDIYGPLSGWLAQLIMYLVLLIALFGGCCVACCTKVCYRHGGAGMV